MAHNIEDLIGLDESSADTRSVIQDYSLDEVEEDPPFRRYIGSRSRGLDLLIENDRVLAAQVFVQAVQGFSAFSGDLPFGLKKDMNQGQVHTLLGPPTEFDKFDSKYLFQSSGKRLVVNFNDRSEITYLNIGALQD
ncbi:outer membrane protein assembly factor BamE [Dyella terrae]|uniref:outer membrane protein assembly factor BamE n=1 Tax=Dyella terrae TaxID=522259 RepID=UPI001EFD7310|nr:outer membrane protein assembly factor BamE [Dyella terrae]ULU24957.1 hypothetical protein DYST_01877 [Dyella terrae]